MIWQGFSKLSTLQKTATTSAFLDQISIFLCLKISKENDQQLFLYAQFHLEKLLVYKIFDWKVLIFHNLPSKAHFSQKAKDFIEPHFGCPYQEIPFWFESQFKGLDPSRAELCNNFLCESSKEKSFLEKKMVIWPHSAIILSLFCWISANLNHC